MGKDVTNIVGLFLTVNFPPIRSNKFLQLANPSPVPVCLVVKRGSKISVNVLCGIPGPESSNYTIISSSFSINLMFILPGLSSIA